MLQVRKLSRDTVTYTRYIGVGAQDFVGASTSRPADDIAAVCLPPSPIDPIGPVLIPNPLAPIATPTNPGTFTLANGDLTKLADCIGNGDFVMGTPVKDWRGLDLRNIAITLSLNGVVAERGASAKILGDPLLALLALANAQPVSGELKAGQIVTTGSCITPLAATRGHYAGDFGALGQASMDFI